MTTAAERVRAAYAAIAAVGRPEVWITLRPEAEALAEAALVEARVAAGEPLPLAGLVAAVKDNIDVGGLPTTAAAPSFAYTPSRDATSVARLRAAGAVVLGKTNLDQFATGLVGTRSPYGVVRAAWDPGRISGGSSSGSAVAVALGLVDIALGTDTAGSGRVPAALNGIVGVKPTRGLIPCTGVVPACRSLDCVAVFARSLGLARRAVAIMSGPDGIDPLATLLGASPRAGGWDPDAGREDAGHGDGGLEDALPSGIRLAIPLPAQLEGLADGWARAFGDVVSRLRACGAQVTEVDIAPLLDAGSLLYGAAFVAERYAAVGEHIAARADLVGDTLDPVVATIILDGARHDAASYFAHRERLDQLAAAAAVALAGFDALLTPTTTAHPTFDEVRADPVGVNARLGRYTNFCNLLDLTALAVPGATLAEGAFGVMLTGPSGSDGRLARIAQLYDQADTDLLVVGAHLAGQPLNHELLAAGGVLIGPVVTAPSYRLYALDTVPPKPGLVRMGDAAQPGACIAAELWRLPTAGLARFMGGLTGPMAIGRVRMDDGREVLGFLCEPAALDGSTDITSYGGWLAYLACRPEMARPAQAPM